MDNANRVPMRLDIRVFVVLLGAFLAVRCEIQDISREVQMLVRMHNDERMNPDLRAANMREMIWDSRLQSQAEQWAKQCLYERPPRSHRVGANLYYERSWARTRGSVRKMVKESLKSWTRQKNYFVYSHNCGSACLYTQMIHADADRIGCAMNTCDDIRLRRYVREPGTIFVCLYSPRVSLQTSLPFIKGEPCSKCQRRELCLGGYLCSQAGSYQEQRIGEPEPTRRPRPKERDIVYERSGDEMTDVLNLHNSVRRDNRLSPLRWDSYLERYCNYVINCNIDYPGPRHAYTNFHRLNYRDQATSAVYDWMSESNVIPPRNPHKCRTPMDIEDCNQYTNMMESTVTRMACSTKQCGAGSRQLVCIYDNERDRKQRYPSSRRVRRLMRRWGR